MTDAAFPLAGYLGLDTGLVEPGTAWAALVVGPEHLNPHGVVHGAVLFAMVDTSMGHVTRSLLDGGRLCASVEVSMRFLRPVRGGRLEARTSVLRRGRRVVHLESRVVDDEQALVATAAGTFAVLEP